METAHVLAAALVGLFVGSLLNRLIVREPGYVIRDPNDLPEGADPVLLEQLEPEPEVGAVPALAVLRPTRVSPRWLAATEVVCAGLFALAVHRVGLGTDLPPVLVLVTGLVALGAVDARVFRLPDRIMAPTLAVGLPTIAAASLFAEEPASIVAALVGGVTYFVLLLLVHLLSPRGMGFGDVKLAFLMGCFLGWRAAATGPFGELVVEVFAAVLAAAMIGSLLGLAVGVVYAAARRSFGAVFPFGPSLAAGCLIVVLYSTHPA